MDQVPLFLRSFQAPVVICVWSDLAMRYVCEASHPTRGPAARQLDNEQWALVIPRNVQQAVSRARGVFRKTNYWMVVNMTGRDEMAVLRAIRQQWRVQILAVGAPAYFALALDEETRVWIFDASTPAGRDLLLQYTDCNQKADLLLAKAEEITLENWVL